MPFPLQDLLPSGRAVNANAFRTFFSGWPFIGSIPHMIHLSKRAIHRFKFDGHSGICCRLLDFMSACFYSCGAARYAILLFMYRWNGQNTGNGVYNQARELAKKNSADWPASRFGKGACESKETELQHLLTLEERKENLKEAYTVKRPEESWLATPSLCDDVCTTGMTMEACAKVLKESGGQNRWWDQLRFNAIMVEIFGRITYNGYNLRFQENGGCNMSGLDIGIDLVRRRL